MQAMRDCRVCLELESAARLLPRPQRVREGRNEGWLRIGDETFAMQATEILGDARRPMLELWSPRAASSRRAIAQAAGETVPVGDSSFGASEPRLLPEIFLWTPR
jgi:hypothetical protein